MKEIPEITETEEWIVSTALKERYGDAKPELQFADAEIRLKPADRDMTTCPVFFWEAEDCHFVIFKTAAQRYRWQCLYRNDQQGSSADHDYDDLSECAVQILLTQAGPAARESRQVNTN